MATRDLYYLNDNRCCSYKAVNSSHNSLSKGRYRVYINCHTPQNGTIVETWLRDNELHWEGDQH